MFVTNWRAVLALGAALGVSDLPGQSIKVTLLGTGGPLPSLERFGPSTLIEAGGQTFLIDAGRGALQRLAQIGVAWRDVDGVLLMVITIGDSIDVRRPTSRK